jgi:predicted transcriptional regulator
MKFDHKSKEILGISAKEADILGTFADNSSAKVTFISQKTNIPRTTVEFLLKKLAKKGLVAKIKIANHYEWQKVNDTELAVKFRHLINNLDIYSEVIGKIEDKSLIIEVFQGEKKIIEAAEKILKFKTHERVYYIQSTTSAQYQTAHFAEQFYTNFQNKLKKSGIIMEVIAAEGILAYFDKLSKKGLESHLGRPIVSYLVPNQYVDFEADIIIHQNNVMIFNYKNESIVLMKNNLISAIMMNFFELIMAHSRKVDLNEYIKNLLK